MSEGPGTPGGPSAGATPVRWFFLASLALSIAVAWDLAVPLSTGAVLAFVSERPIAWAARRLGREGSRPLRWALSAALVALAFLLIVLPVGIALYVAVHDLITAIAARDQESWLSSVKHLLATASAALERVGIALPTETLYARAREAVASNGGYLVATLASALSATPQALFNGSVVVLSWMWLAVDGAEARRRVLPRLLPWPRERAIIARTTAEVIEGVIVSNVLVSFVQAMLCGFALLALRVPRAVVWGVLSFFLSFVPVVGTASVTIGAALYLVWKGRVAAAIAMGVVAIVVATIDNVLRPLFMRSSSDLNFLWVLVALVGGVSLFGLPGVVLGPLAFSLFSGFLAALDGDEGRGASASPATEPEREGEPPPEA